MYVLIETVSVNNEITRTDTTLYQSVFDACKMLVIRYNSQLKELFELSEALPNFDNKDVAPPFVNATCSESHMNASIEHYSGGEKGNDKTLVEWKVTEMKVWTYEDFLTIDDFTKNEEVIKERALRKNMLQYLAKEAAFHLINDMEKNVGGLKNGSEIIKAKTVLVDRIMHHRSCGADGMDEIRIFIQLAVEQVILNYDSYQPTEDLWDNAMHSAFTIFRDEVVTYTFVDYKDFLRRCVYAWAVEIHAIKRTKKSKD